MLCNTATCETFLTNTTFVDIEDYRPSRRLSSSFSHFNPALIADRSASTKRRIKYSQKDMFTQTFYLGAVSKGYVFGTRRIDLNVTCGGEILRHQYPQYINPYKTTLWIGTGTKMIPASIWQAHYSNDISNYCPIMNYTMWSNTINATSGDLTTKYFAELIVNNNKSNIYIYGNNFPQGGNYTFNITATSKGGV